MLIEIKEDIMIPNIDIAEAMTIKLDDVLPEMPKFQEGIRRAPDRGFRLSQSQTEIALKNALRYIPEKYHQQLIPEFLEELTTRGRIYGYRFRPEGNLYGKPIGEYKGNCIEGKATSSLSNASSPKCRCCSTHCSFAS